MPSEYIPAPNATSPRSRGAFLRACLLLTVWYLSSSLAIILTKAVFSGSGRRLPPFPFGLTVTASNNVIAGIAATLLFGPPTELRRDGNINRLALVIGATTAAEIGLSNIALNLLSVSYSTVLKGMAPLFVMAWGAILGLHRLRFSVISTMVAMAVGLALAVAGESKQEARSLLSQFVQAGFLCQLVSALLSGFRWMLTQVFVKGEAIANERFSSLLNIRALSRGLSAVETIRLTAPYTILWVLPFVAAIEGPALVQWVLNATLMHVINLFTILMIIGVCVYALLWAEYELVRVTSSLTVSVGFVLKEVIVIYAGAMIFNDHLSTLTFVGFAIVQCGILAYAFLRNDSLARDPNSSTSET